jgi:hypothetical protein
MQFPNKVVKKKPNLTLQIIVGCEHCGAKFKTSHVKSAMSAICAMAEGVYVVYRHSTPDILPLFFCSEECMRAEANES